MHVYAQLDETRTVVGISYLSAEVVEDSMINITKIPEKPVIGSKYDSLSETFAPPSLLEDSAVQPTIEEKILAENQYQTMLLELSSLGGQ